MSKRDELRAIADDIDRRGWKALMEISTSSEKMALVAAALRAQAEMEG